MRETKNGVKGFAFDENNNIVYSTTTNDLSSAGKLSN